MNTRCQVFTKALDRQRSSLLLTLLLLVVAPAVAAEKSSPFVGAWRLMSYRALHADGRLTDVFGKPTGQLIYAPDGRMSVHMLDLEPTRSPPGNSGYSGYWGRYEVAADGASVQHFVENFSTLRDRPASGTVLSRTVKLDGKRLTLTTPPRRYRDEMVTMVLVWERIG